MFAFAPLGAACLLLLRQEQHVYSLAQSPNMALRRSAMLMVYQAYEAINMLLQIEQSKIREITHK
jgi:hypothetical protein